MRILKQVITLITCLVQIFCAFWFLARGFVAIVLMIYNWQSTATPLAELLRLSYEMIWLGLLPILLFGLTLWSDSFFSTLHASSPVFYERKL